MQHLCQHLEWRQGSCVLDIIHGAYLFNFLQDGEIKMRLQDHKLLGNYDVSEEGNMVEFDTQTFVEETTTDKFQRIDGDRTMNIYILDLCMHAL